MHSIAILYTCGHWSGLVILESISKNCEIWFLSLRVNDFVNFCIDVLIGQFDKNKNHKFYSIYHSRNLSIVVGSSYFWYVMYFKIVIRHATTMFEWAWHGYSCKKWIKYMLWLLRHRNPMGHSQTMLTSMGRKPMGNNITY